MLQGARENIPQVVVVFGGWCGWCGWCGGGFNDCFHRLWGGGEGGRFGVELMLRLGDATSEFVGCSLD